LVGDLLDEAGEPWLLLASGLPARSSTSCASMKTTFASASRRLRSSPRARPRALLTSVGRVRGGAAAALRLRRPERSGDVCAAACALMTSRSAADVSTDGGRRTEREAPPSSSGGACIEMGCAGERRAWRSAGAALPSASEAPSEAAAPSSVALPPERRG
jgi:hypothetical protein